MNDILNRRIIVIGICCIFGWVFAYLATNVFRNYAFGLFIWLPFVMGVCSTILHGYGSPTNKKELWKTSFYTLGVFCLGLLIFAFEGIICLVMAAPIGLLFTWIGHWVGFQIIKGKMATRGMSAVFLLLASVPFIMGFELKVQPDDEIRSVVTSVEINAPRNVVWKNIIQFPPLEESTEFIFKAGIAYPVNASIDGNGIGAMRHCNFSTGSFLEPITIWNEDSILNFDVKEQPEPMVELSPYNIRPNHLHGYWISKRGEFKLVTLSNGHTLLLGTTWYVNKIKPGVYWTLWSDNIVHTIHQRVLNHIKRLSESN